MAKHNVANRRAYQPLAYLYGFSLLLLTLTGFGQMPIFKRYYIADIPGLGWLAQFYVTHYLHYLAAIVLLAMAGYVIARYLAHDKNGISLTVSGRVRAGLLGLLIVTGLFLVWRNLAGVILPPGFIILLDISHLLLVMLLLGVTGFCRVTKRSWTVARAAAVKES